MISETWCGTCHPTAPSGAAATSQDDSRIFVPYGASLRAKGFEGFSLYGWRKASELSVHLLPNVEFALASAVADFYKKWKYVPPNLSVRFVRMGMMGRTVLTKSAGDVHWVLLNRRLLEAYTLEAIRRVMLHELSHCYRHHVNEYELLDEPHDQRFCEILSRVDKLVAGSRKKCKFFTDDVDDISARQSLGQRLSGGGTMTIWPDPPRRRFTLETASHVVLREGFLRDQELLEIAAGLGDDQRRVQVRLLKSRRGKSAAPPTTFDRFFLNEVFSSKPAFKKLAGPYVLAPLDPAEDAGTAGKKKRTPGKVRGTLQRGSRSR